MKSNIPWSLIISKLSQNIREEEERLFDEWIGIENNKELFRQIETVWKNIQEKNAGYEPDVQYYWEKLSAKIHENAVLEKKTKRISLSYLSKIAAVAAVVIISISFVFIHYLRESKSQEYITYSTQDNKINIFLPDSSEVMLHANTVLNYQFDKKLGQRKVNITGEAYFKVKHDDKIPFLVNANEVFIKVHGTEFNVCSYDSRDKIQVSLIEGSISMHTSSEKHIFLKPGEEGSYDKTHKRISVANGDMDLAKIWTGDKVRFENKSLTEVCKYLSKWYGVNIIIDSGIKGNQSYTFTVTDQPLTEIIEIMSSVNSFDYYFPDKNELVLKTKK